MSTGERYVCALDRPALGHGPLLYENMFNDNACAMGASQVAERSRRVSVQELEQKATTSRGPYMGWGDVCWSTRLHLQVAKNLLKRS